MTKSHDDELQRDRLVDDLDDIYLALKSLRNLAYDGRRGGLMEEYELAVRGLEAVERIKSSQSQ
jgi:predicted DNA-binding protein